MNCSGPVWVGNDIASCYRGLLLETIPFGIMGVASALVVIYRIPRYRLRKGKRILLPDHCGTEDEQYRALASVYDSVDYSINLTSPTTLDRAFMSIESACLTALTGLALFRCLAEKDLNTSSLTVLCFWIYVSSLSFARMVLREGSGLWYHAVSIYPIAWALSALSLRSAIQDSSSPWLSAAQFTLVSIIFLCVWTSSYGDEPEVLYVSKDNAPTVEAKSSLFSIATFGFLNSLLNKGFKNTLQYEDLWDLRIDDQAVEALRVFHAQPKEGSVLRQALHQLKWKLVVATSYAIIQSLLKYAPALLIRFVLVFIENPEAYSLSFAWTCVFTILIATFVYTIIDSQALYIGLRVGTQLRSIIIGEVYGKALRRKAASYDGQASTGSVINLMSIDALKVSDLFSHLHFILGSLVQIIAGIFFLYFVVGWSALIGAVICLAFVPLNTWWSTAYANFESKILEETDNRIAKTNEVFQCIRIIKYFAWEDKFADQIRDIRTRELKHNLNRFRLWAIGTSLWLITPISITIGTFAPYTLMGNELTPSVAFTALTLFALFRNPIENMGETFSEVLDAQVSLKRLNKFLNESETSKSDQLNLGTKTDFIGFENASFAWSNGPSIFQLFDLDVEFPNSKLTVVSGPTGCGKTSLLMALLGEMDLVKGNIYLPDQASGRGGHNASRGHYSGVSYCSQQAWLLNDTIKENILFDSPYDEQRFNEVIEACGLTPDLEIFANGEETEVGERGIVLSGGQKQRISLARAIYSRSSTLLLDDCLSAVDADTAFHIYDNCLAGPLSKDRTIILVSHNIALTTSKADKLVVMEQGRIVAQGRPEEIIDPGSIWSSDSRSATVTRNNSDVSIDTKKKQESKPPGSGHKLIQKEFQNEGAVGREVTLMYFGYIGPWIFWVGLLLAFAVENFFRTWVNLWIREWAMDLRSASLSYYITIYLVLGIISCIVTPLEIMYLFSASVKASRSMMDDMLNSVLSANLRFFDSTPIGRITNRFGKDVETIDQKMPEKTEGMFYLVITAGLTIAIIVYVTPVALLVLLVLLIIYLSISRFYLRSCRELKRMESVAKSPMYQHFGQTLNGVTTIRAFGQSQRFINENVRGIDYFTRPSFWLKAANIWLTLRMEMLSASVSFAAGAFALLSYKSIDSGLAGLSISYATSLSSIMLWAAKCYSEFELGLNAVERVSEYIAIEGEPQDGNEPPVHWPSRGEIEFKNLSLKYAPELPRVIKNVSVKIPAHSKIGVVGRTGAGKSTIITALFRFLEADEGSIVIDGVDISTLRLNPLRRALAIIPQDPTLFAGTIRSNLDPFDEFSDPQIHESLRRVHLVDRDIADGEQVNQFRNLESPVTELGQNLSQGQRQLLCLARALLKQPKILLMDEATASIDYDTDAKIQQTIREEFKDCTLLTIAHRLKSIIDYDQILVLEQGELVQFGAPKELINSDGLFRDMCIKSGQHEELKAAM